jgi:hypothetical protein
MTSGIAVDNTNWAEATKRFGKATVAHILDLPVGIPPHPKDIRRQNVVKQLAISFGDEPKSGEQRVSFLCFRLSLILPNHDMTLFESIRQYLGGHLPSKTGDNLIDALVRLVFNGLAMEHIPGADRDRTSISAAFQDPRLYSPAAKAFLNDSDLARLFPDASAETDEQGHIRVSSLLLWLPGGGGTTDLPILLGSFVEQTLARMRFVNQLTEAHIEDYVVASLKQLRKLARGEQVDVLVLTGLMGIEVEDTFNCGSWGIKPAHGLAISQIPLGEDELNRPKSILWMKAPHRLVALRRADVDEEEATKVFHEFSKLGRELHSGLKRNTLALQFALLAWAVEEQPYKAINVQATSSWSMVPLAATQPPWLYESAAPNRTTKMKLADLQTVASVVNGLGKPTHRLDIALSRIVRVATEDRRPADALIDAVIAWENMLGSKSETTFKVCAALSLLLEPNNSNARRTLFAQAKKIYNLRSRIVHGEIEDDTAEAIKLSKEALGLAVRSFRRIHAKPQLRDMRSSSRAERILLGGKISYRFHNNVKRNAPA